MKLSPWQSPSACAHTYTPQWLLEASSLFFFWSAFILKFGSQRCDVVGGNRCRDIWQWQESMEADSSLEKEEDNDDGLQPYNFEPAFSAWNGRHAGLHRCSSAVWSLYRHNKHPRTKKASPFLFLSAKRKTPMNPMRLEPVLRAQTQWFAIMNNNRK